jgi:BirA family biotin operon repressor/biotin-[acetyl-CoA-carboxylase] ligase
VWLSAALPWPPHGPTAAVGLAVAVGLILRLEELGLAVRLKWPNDLMLGGHKLAGLLPGLRRRAEQVRWARVGVGLNGRNRVPPGAISLRSARGTWAADPLRLTALVLAALEWAVAAAPHPELVRRQAEQRLLIPAGPLRHEGETWWVRGLAVDGGLRLARGEHRRVLHRCFDPAPPPFPCPAGADRGGSGE